MEYLSLGNSGLKISPIIIGCMSFGDPTRGGPAWSLTEDRTREFVKKALDAGVTTFDTADVYSDGTSEEYVGRALKDFARREEVVIASKVHGRMHPGPNGQGLSRLHIMQAIDASLRRLGTDHIDLYQIHRFDPSTPIEETMEALHDIIKAGKVRYIGASSMHAWQFAQMQHAADLGGWTRFISMQDQYNLLMREEEREMHPYCLNQHIGVIPWSPLARGRVTRPWKQMTNRAKLDGLGEGSPHSQDEAVDRAIVSSVEKVAAAHGLPMAQVALAWVRQQPAVTAPIVGLTKLEQLDDAIASLDLTLTAEELAALAAPYRPQHPDGFQ